MIAFGDLTAAYERIAALEAENELLRKVAEAAKEYLRSCQVFEKTGLLDPKREDRQGAMLEARADLRRAVEDHLGEANEKGEAG